MKLATAIVMTLGLLATPVGCLLLPCPIDSAPHDCCPRTPVLAACPMDILASAKAAPQQHATPAALVVFACSPVFSPAPAAIASVVSNGRDPHLESCVLRL